MEWGPDRLSIPAESAARFAGRTGEREKGIFLTLLESRSSEPKSSQSASDPARIIPSQDEENPHGLGEGKAAGDDRLEATPGFLQYSHFSLLKLEEKSLPSLYPSLGGLAQLVRAFA